MLLLELLVLPLLLVLPVLLMVLDDELLRSLCRRRRPRLVSLCRLL